MKVWTPPRIAPRLLLIFAVAACVLGWTPPAAATLDAAGHAHASAVSMAAGDGTSLDAVTEPGERRVGPGVTVERAAVTAGQVEDRQGSAGRGSHKHAFSCLTGPAAAAALSVLAAPAVAALVAAAFPSQPRLLGTGSRPAKHRFVSITTLCVQRI